MDNNVSERWENFLNPETLKGNMIVASLYITAFELLKQSIIDRIKEFYTFGFDQNGPIVDEKHINEVLNKKKGPLYSSLSWLKDHNVIDEDDLNNFEGIKRLRNKMAHELMSFLGGNEQPDLAKNFNNMVNILHKIETWWMVNVEIPTDPDLYDNDIEIDNITPGSIITLRLMVDIALGSDEKASYYYNEFIKRVRRNSDVQ